MERLQKVIAQAGVCSRREAEKLIQAGKVMVNSQIVVELGTKVNTSDVIKVNNKLIKRNRLEYYVLYKPKHVISSTSDDKDRTTVIDLIKSKARLYPVGRLDYDTTGVLLITNDGEFANMMMHPRNKILKTYVAYVSGMIDASKIKELEKGVMIDNYQTAKAKAKILDKDFANNNCTVQLIIAEGKNHQVKKMFEAIGLKVRKLHRSKYGLINLNGLVPGMYRPLTSNEIKELKLMASI